MRASGLLVAAATVTIGLVSSALAQVTFEEATCEVKTSLAGWKYVASKMSCLVSCQRAVRAGTTDPSECVPPYASSKTFGCIQGKQGRTNGRICSSCNPDPPECYPADICPQTTGAIIDYLDLGLDGSIMPLIYCDDSGSPDGLNYFEGRCQDSVARYMAKAAYSRAKCIARCRLSELKGVLPSGACALPPTDPTTLVCLDKVELATVPRIERYCGAPYGDAPDCHAFSGSDWIQIMEISVDAYDGYFFCES